MAENARENLKSGFKTCGIHPMNKDEVLSKMPNNQSHDDAADILSTSVTEMLQEMRYDKQKKAPKKRKLLAVEPGKSISTSDIATTDTGEESSAPKKTKKTKKKAKCLKKTKPGRLNKEQEGRDVNNNTTHGSDSSNDPIPQVSQVSASPSGQLEVNAPTFPSQTCRGSSDPETLPGTSKMSDTQQVPGIDNDTTGATAGILLREVKNLNDLGQNTLVAAVYENKWWIGKVLDVSDENNDVEIFFMVPSGPSQKFQWGGSDEKCWVKVKHILGIVPSLQLLPFGKICMRFFQIPEELMDEIEAKFLNHLMV
ncbi:hypothetical protein SNE40_021196 [Patella caerulea]|uniref:Uncharacterized protein n=1 Tax=Patella caerulea TaxID=87958 RepID=A0AAN8FYZ4_PATCE